MVRNVIRGNKFLFLLLMVMITVMTAVKTFAFDFQVRPRGFVLFPAGDGSADTYNVGGGGELLFDLDLASIWPNPLMIGYTAGLEGGFAFAPLASGAGDSLSLLSGGIGLSLYYYPISRMALRVDGAFGLYQGSITGSSSSWYGRIGGEAGFRFTPNFILSLNSGWKYFNNAFAGESYGASSGRASSPAALFQGVYLGITAQLIVAIHGSGRTESGGVSITVVQDDPVYPVFLGLYQSYQAASLTLRNNESAEIKDVRVSFRAGDYTASELPCGTIGRLDKGRGAEIPLLADFSQAVLNFTENGRIVGEVVIRYTLLGKAKEIIRPAMVQVYNRNIYPAGDNAGLAAFVSPSSQEVLEYSKAVTGMARASRRMGLNNNMQFGMWLFEGLKAAGLGVEAAVSSLDEVQFPAQTLAYNSGTARDIGLLYAASLEAAGIEAAYIPLKDDFITLIGLAANEAAAASLFNGRDKILIIDGAAWLPLLMSEVERGFTSAWQGGVNTLNAIFAANEEVELIMLSDAWAMYPPAPFPPLGVRITPPDMGTVRRNADTAISAYINSEITPLLQTTQRQIQAGATAALHNRLGILQMRAGRIAECKASYERAAGMGSVPAMTNRGSLAMTEKDYAAAEGWFRQALAADPGNEAAQRGLAQIAENN